VKHPVSVILHEAIGKTWKGVAWTVFFDKSKAAQEILFRREDILTLVLFDTDLEIGVC